jgi:hypothetical protein
MSQQQITQEGALTHDTATALNANFSELYASTAGGTLTSGHLLVGNASNVSTDTAVTGDVTISNAGVTAIKDSVALTTPNIGAATGTSVVLSGDCKAATYHVGSTAGASGTGSTITAITVVNGIVTAITVS